MILYNVTVNIENELSADWVKWMKEVHIPEVMATGSFLEYKMFRIMHEEEGGGISYCVQYFASSMNELMDYQQKFAPALQAKTKERYKDRFVAFRTVLELI
jgi:hypothetical protein